MDLCAFLFVIDRYNDKYKPPLLHKISLKTIKLGTEVKRLGVCCLHLSPMCSKGLVFSLNHLMYQMMQKRVFGLADNTYTVVSSKLEHKFFG